MPDQANHAIRDGNYPIVYIAGELGGLYKYFPDSGEIFLMKGIDTEAGERGRMVGYGALTLKPPVSGVLELVVMPIVPQGGAGADQDKIRHFIPGDGWISKTPPAPGRSWQDLNISPINANNWVAYTGARQAWADNDLWVTANNGASWTRVAMQTSGSQVTVYWAGWSPHAADFLWVAARTETGDGTADVWYGNPFTETLTRVAILPSRRRARWYGVAVMDNGDLVLRGHTGGALASTHTNPGYVVHPDGTRITYATTIPSGPQQVINLLGTDNILDVAGEDRTLYKAETYETANYTSTGLNTTTEGDSANTIGQGARGYLEVLTGMRWFTGRPPGNEGIKEITNPFGSPSILTSYGAGFPVGSVRADSQSRTALAAMSKRLGQSTGQALFYVFSEGAWAEMAGPEDAHPSGMSEFALEPIVRPE